MIGQDSSTGNSRSIEYVEVRVKIWLYIEPLFRITSNERAMTELLVRVTYVLIMNKFSFGNTMSG